MPSGPESFVTQPAYSSEFSKARGLLLAHPKRWRIVYHYDGDGIASASSLGRALSRLGYAYQATPLRAVERGRMEELLTGTSGPLLVVDTGSSWLDLYGSHPHPVIILDHHRYPGVPQPPPLPDHVAFVNPLDWGVDGMSEMCAATLSWLFTLFLDPKNWDNAPWGLSGAIADRQHVGGFRGLNGRLVEEAVARSLVRRTHRIALQGRTMEVALARSIDPYYAGLSNRPEEARAFLQGVNIDPVRPVEALESEEEIRLVAALTARLARQGVRPEFCEQVARDRWELPSLALPAEELSNLQNATGRIGHPGLGVAISLGDTSAIERAREAEETWRTGILRGMQRIEDGGVKSMSALQWFESAETTLAGTQAGLAMNYLLDPRKPVVVFSDGTDDLKLSGRGTRWLVDQGLDLSSAIRDAAASVGGEGGGHSVASGATIPKDRREAFLEHLNRTVGAQLAGVLSGAAR